MSNENVFKAVGRVNSLSVMTIDAYGVAVKNGFEGTVEEWLESLQGKDYVLTDEDKKEIANLVYGENVDLAGYATEQYVEDYAQPKGDYLTKEDYPEIVDYVIQHLPVYDGEVVPV